MYPKNNVIVISPSALLYNFINGMVQYGVNISDNRYSFYTYEKYIRNPKKAINSLLIVDEAHNFRTQIMTQEVKDEENEEVVGEVAVQNKRGYKLMQFGSDYAHKVLLLTGTLFINTIYDVENLLAMVDKRPPIRADDFSKVIVNADTIKDYFNYRISYEPRSPDSIYFPKMIEEIIPLYLTNEEEEHYNKIKLEGRPDTESKKPNNFYQAELYGSNMVGENKKIDWIIKKIVDNPNQKFIVYSTLYNSGVKIILEKLKDKNIEYTTITGKQSSNNKEVNKNYFNAYNFGIENFQKNVDEKLQKYINDKYRVLVITKAGAEGVDTINCQNVILLNSLWNDATSEQIIARAIRYKSHFGLPEKERYVNVYRLLIAKESNKEVVDTILNPNFKKFCNLKKEISETTKEHLRITKASDGKFDLTIKKLKELKTDKNTPFIPEITKMSKKRTGFNKKMVLSQDGVDGWDKYEGLKDEKEKKRWRMRIYSEWYGQYGVGERERNPLKEGLFSCTADILMYIMSKSKTENINDFCSLLGNDISLFEKYQSDLLNKIVEIEKKLGSKMSEEFQAHIYANLLKSYDVKILSSNYKPVPKPERSKEEQLQEYFTNATLATYILNKSSILQNDGKIQILEPSAGDGALIRPLLELEKDITIDLVEINRTNRRELEEFIKKYPTPAMTLLDQKNFLTFNISTRYDYIFMNPPFHLRKSENARLLNDVWDFDFVKRAFAFLKRGGELVAITGTHFLLDEQMQEWYADTKFKTFEYETKGKQTFKPLTGRGITYEPIIIKITKKKPQTEQEESLFDKMENEIIGINFYKDGIFYQQIGEQILNNEIPITKIIKPKEEPKETPFDEPKEEPLKNIIVKKEPPKKNKPFKLIEEPKIEIPEPEPQPANIEPVVNKLEDKIKEFEEIGRTLGARIYSPSVFIQVVAYIALLLEYDRKCSIITEDIEKIKINNKEKSPMNYNFYKNAESLSNDLLDCIKRGDKIIGIPLSLKFGSSSDGHANMLIYRPDDKTIERFEPHGATFQHGGKDDDTFNKILKEMFEVKMKPYLKEYTPRFYNPSERCPNPQGFQSLENKISEIKGEGGGFCGLWSLFALELMFMNPTMKTPEILKLAFDITKRDPQYIKNVIRGYVVKTEKLLDNYIKKIDETGSFNFSKYKNLHSYENKIQNNLLHLLASWNSKNTTISKLEEKVNKNKTFDNVEELLKSKSLYDISNMVSTLIGGRFPKKYTKEQVIATIIYLLKEKKKPALTKESITNYFNKNITI
jgi:16S rRNA G966 N2-methylase RsmD